MRSSKEPQSSVPLSTTLTNAGIHLCIYAPGTFFCNPLKPIVNSIFGSSYAIAYAHFRRDHSKPANVWAHVGCLFLQVIGNFALLDCMDSLIGLPVNGVIEWNIASLTAIAWAVSLLFTPSPISVRLGTIAVLAGALAARAFFTEAVGYASFALFIGPGEVMCYWLYLPDHGISRPGPLGCLALLLGRSLLWFTISNSTGVLGAWLGAPASNAAVVFLLALGSLIRSENNLPLVSQFGSSAWVLAMLLGQPWVFFLSLSFLGAGLQGVAHERTQQVGTLNQLKDASYELAHTSFFPLLTLQSLHHGWFGPHPATVRDLGKHGDTRSRKALGLCD